MDETQLAAFFDRVLPSGAYYGPAVSLPRFDAAGKRIYTRKSPSITSTRVLARAMLVAASTGCAYYATCGFVDPAGPQKNTNAGKRVSIIHDVDFKGGLSVDNLTEFKVALREAVKLGLPKPNAVVLSGHGAHLYWLFQQAYAFGIEQHTKMSRAFSAWMKLHAPKLAQDTNSLVDFVRVLRPPGTFNRKDLANPVPVTLAADDGGYVSLPALRAFVAEASALQGSTQFSRAPRAAAPVAQPASTGVGSLVVAEAPSPSDSARDIVTKCGVLREYMQRLKPTGWVEFDQTRWIHTAVLLAKAPDGEAFWKSLSRADPRVTVRASDAELDMQWQRVRADYGNGGVMTCGTVRTHFFAPRADGTSPCDTCPVAASGRHNAGPGNFSAYERAQATVLRRAPPVAPLDAGAYPPRDLPPVRHSLPLVYSELDKRVNAMREVPLLRADAINRFVASLSQAGARERFYYVGKDGGLYVVRFAANTPTLDATRSALRAGQMVGPDVLATDVVVIHLQVLVALPVQRVDIAENIKGTTFQYYKRGDFVGMTDDENIRHVTLDNSSFAGAQGANIMARATGCNVVINAGADWNVCVSDAMRELVAKTSVTLPDFLGYDSDDGTVGPDTAFCHGTLKITAAGYSATDVSPRYAATAANFGRRGDAEEQRRLVRDYMEIANNSLRCTVWAALSAPLYAVLASVRSEQALPILAIHGRNSSGKSKALAVGCAFWGKKSALKEGAGNKTSTIKGRYSALAHYTNVPLFQDEIIMSLGEDAVEVLKNFSNNSDRKGLTITGEQWKLPKEKRTVFIGVSNVDPVDFIMRDKRAAFEDRTSVVRRLVSWYYDPNSPEHSRTKEEQDAMDLLSSALSERHYGFLGPAFVRFILANLSKVRTVLAEEYDAAREALTSDEIGTATYATFQACTVAAARLGAELGYWQMEDEADFYRKIVQHYTNDALRAANAAAQIAKPDDAYRTILDKLRDATTEFDTESGIARQPPNNRSPEAKRNIQKRMKAETTFILATAFDREAQALGLSPATLLGQLAEIGYMARGRDKVDHGLNSVPRTGMSAATAQGLKSKCYCFTTPLFTVEELNAAGDAVNSVTPIDPGAAPSNVVQAQFGGRRKARS